MKTLIYILYRIRVACNAPNIDQSPNEVFFGSPFLKDSDWIKNLISDCIDAKTHLTLCCWMLMYVSLKSTRKNYFSFACKDVLSTWPSSKTIMSSLAWWLMVCSSWSSNSNLQFSNLKKIRCVQDQLSNQGKVFPSDPNFFSLRCDLPYKISKSFNSVTIKE